MKDLAPAFEIAPELAVPSEAFANMCSYDLLEVSRLPPVRQRSAPGSVLPGLV
jgi:hypothetical protein